MTKLEEFLFIYKPVQGQFLSQKEAEWIATLKDIIRKQAEALQDIADAKEYKFEVIDDIEDDDGQIIRVTNSRMFIVPYSHAEQCQKEIEEMLK